MGVVGSCWYVNYAVENGVFHAFVYDAATMWGDTMRWMTTSVIALALSGCSTEEELRDADFVVQPGVESVTVVGAEPEALLTLYSPTGDQLVTVQADQDGTAHFSYLPDDHIVLDLQAPEPLSLANGRVVPPGEGYVIQDDRFDPPPWSQPFNVMGVDDVATPDFYASQTLEGVHMSPLTGVEGDVEDGYQYLEMRDGVLLGAMVRFPDKLLYGDGPWPTVVEYSGYSPSKPDNPDSGTFIANALGYATVSVNMRGSGCSGGVFDVFNRAQHADGYDIIEIVAAQEWALNHKVGMVGLSYPGVSQLYVASTNPPSLGGVVPLSTIADAWEMQWPGGIYNRGFTRQWVNERESQSQANGSSWVTQRMEAGDDICEDNLRLSHHSVDFEAFLRSLTVRPAAADDRDIRLLVEQIRSPVFFGGQFQDEQTGPQFGEMLDRFYQTEDLHVLMSNGRHPDGYAPHAVTRWFEFLEFYVAERIPVLHPAIRAFAANEFGSSFEMYDVVFEPDRFVDYATYDAALAAYQAEPEIRLLLESGGDLDDPGPPGVRFETELATWPIPDRQVDQFFLGPNNHLGDPADAAGGAEFAFDPEAGDTSFFGERGYELLVALWDHNWTRFDQGKMASFITEPFADTRVLAGPAVADLWVKSSQPDADLQVTLTEVRPDGDEVLLQSGWLRVGHRKGAITEDLRIERTYTELDYEPIPSGEWVHAPVAIHSFAHPVRPGSRVRMIISTPGRDHGTWAFEPNDDTRGAAVSIGWGEPHASSLMLPWVTMADISAEFPDCDGLRGQPCRAFQPIPNVELD